MPTTRAVYAFASHTHLVIRPFIRSTQDFNEEKEVVLTGGERLQKTSEGALRNCGGVNSQWTVGPVDCGPNRLWDQ